MVPLPTVRPWSTVRSLSPCTHTSVPDAALDAYTYYHTMGGRNYQSYSKPWADEAMDKLLTAIRRVLGGEEIAAIVSGGDYSRRNLVRAVRRHESGEPGSPMHR